jgi:hypothetical protein
MSETKKLAIYDTGKDPVRKGVTHVAIQTQATPHYVFATYLDGQQRLTSTSDIKVIPLGTALCEYEFRPGKISEVVR